MILPAVLLGLLAGVAFVLVYGSLSWRRETKRLHRGLEAAREPLPVAVYREAELEGLPAPVQRYFRAVLADGQPIVSGVHVVHRGTFNMGEGGDRWQPFTSTQRVVTRRPGFDWEARVAIRPWLAIRVHDAYVAGAGFLHASVLGLVSFVRLQGTPEVARGELLRWFAETAWYPTALLPSQGVRWRALDDDSAEAMLSDGELTLTLRFRFGAEGLIKSVRAEDRGRTVGREVVPTPWQGSWTSYERRDGMFVPLEGEVAWLLPEGPRPYWRGRIMSLRYEYAPEIS